MAGAPLLRDAPTYEHPAFTSRTVRGRYRPFQMVRQRYREIKRSDNDRNRIGALSIAWIEQREQKEAKKETADMRFPRHAVGSTGREHAKADEEIRQEPDSAEYDDGTI